MQNKDPLNRLAAMTAAHEEKMERSFSLVPSENSLSPLARLFFLSDMYSRYYFDDDRLWGNWAFPGGKNIGQIQEEIVLPALRRLSGAEFINIKPISGLSGMMAAMSAYAGVGSRMLCVPGSLGGHASTQFVAERLGLAVDFLPPKGLFDFDEGELIKLLSGNDVALIYIDQANVLFPLDISKIRRCLKEAGSNARLHVDSSHLNGLIFGGVLENPLLASADSFGGSLHKSFPGPHKAFFATNDKTIYESFANNAAHLISHHHAADVLALAVALLEFERCDGAGYARSTVSNAQAFAGVLHEEG
ncbi:MAG: hypothetical protein PHY92_08230, partial [Alphaproteobacteria bacterium]|nr:hypothetical protein [Alphaproteobacteria bacterium]